MSIDYAAQSTRNILERSGNQHRLLHQSCNRYNLYAGNISKSSIDYAGSPEHLQFHGANGNQHRHMHLNCYHYSLYVGVWFLMYAWSIIYRSIAYTGSPEH
jgi:hypothetical protein